MKPYQVFSSAHCTRDSSSGMDAAITKPHSSMSYIILLPPLGFPCKPAGHHVLGQ